jgi:Family of unknown function (DUF5317)
VVLIALTVIVGILVGLVLGGSLRDFPTVDVRGWPLALAGIVLQFLNPPGALGHATLLASFLLLLVFAAMNVAAPGFLLILVGLAINALVIAANGGMPVTARAVERSGQEDALADLREEGGAKHHLADDGSVLLVLGDVIGIPRPVGQAASVGDLVLDTGIAWYIAAATVPRRREPV